VLNYFQISIMLPKQQLTNEQTIGNESKVALQANNKFNSRHKPQYDIPWLKSSIRRKIDSRVVGERSETSVDSWLPMLEVSSWCTGVGFMFKNEVFVSGKELITDDMFVVVATFKLLAWYVPFKSISGKSDMDLVV